MRRIGKHEEGFTLMELLVVIIIIGILAAVAVPVFLNQKQKASQTSVKSDIHAEMTMLEDALVENGDVYPTTLPVIAKSPGVVVAFGGAVAAPLTHDMQEFLDFDAFCNSGVPEQSCTLDPTTGYYSLLYRGDYGSSINVMIGYGAPAGLWFGAGEYIGWTGDWVKVPAFGALAATAPTDSNHYCIEGYHTSAPTVKTHFDSTVRRMETGACT